MRPRTALLLFAAGCSGAGESAGPISVPPSHEITVSAASTAAFLQALSTPSLVALHGIARLDRDPTPADREALASRGLTVLSYYSGRLYRVRVRPGVDSAGTLPPPLGGLALLGPVDRVAPALFQRRYDVYQVPVPGPRKLVNYVVTTGDTLKLTVFFQAGVPDTTVTRLLTQYAHEPRRSIDGVWLVRATTAELGSLAAEDAVQWIGPGAPPLVPDNDLTRSTVQVDQLQQFNFGTGLPKELSGKGIQAGIYDVGIDEGHEDFLDRHLGFSTTSRIAVTAPERTLHGTMVAGVVGGSGIMSWMKDSWGTSNGLIPFRWRGMAPLVEMLEVVPSFGPDKSLIFDGSAHLGLIQDHGMDLSNHSINADGDGSYGSVSVIIDRVIRGDASTLFLRIPSKPQVWSAGNFGANGYLTLRKQLKNAIVVGNWYAAMKRPDGTGSLGPTDDGRIKPDLMAPGTFIRSPGFWDLNAGEAADYSASACFTNPGLNPPAGKTVRQNFYGVLCGTSLSAPVVTGVSALVLEQYAKSYGADLDQRPPLTSTLRGLLIHSATDATGIWTHPEYFPAMTVMGLRGPDFATGWGLLNAAGAADLVKGMQILEATAAMPCETQRWSFSVLDPLGGTAPVTAKITLTWDDPAADPALAPGSPKLVNDLDLVLVDPDGNRHYPWRLNQTITDDAGSVVAPKDEVCGSTLKVGVALGYGITQAMGLITAAVEGTDHLNNVEQVVATGSPGNWQALVTGFRLTTTQQQYSLIGIPTLVTPFNQRPKTICETMKMLCTRWVTPVCDKYPRLCSEVPPLLVDPDAIRVTFANGEDRAIVPLAPLCIALHISCFASMASRRYQLHLFPAGVRLGAMIIDSLGARVAGDSLPAAAPVLTIPPLSGGRYFLLLFPGPEVRPGVEIRVPVRISGAAP